MTKQLVFILGGTRSGKSARALSVTRGLAGEARAWFLATAVPGDPELDRRIRRHRQQRPAEWPTIEVDRDLAGAINATDGAETLVIEGLTLWLSQLAGDGPIEPDSVLEGPFAEAMRAIEKRIGPVVIVSDEIGLGIVPLGAHTRAYRDVVGLVHQRLAARADVVELVVAGLPVPLKRPPA